ncbi:FixH family protein [Brevibacillus agri]|uniref:FixH family protein n=1 Tax=Brevibacillus agri TaxID=51101 RepID=UPI002E248206|nr:FixH family protein [Brevibacillus agri]MED1655314.1 FixH family protein [Brevibacillus agri]MED1689367.1 FixH family protein [Brevibacillus agri]MED1694814.1 FixH family protein [Brevibacillus agri]MED1699669.1 FixH family protein [Brevibacillus agri]
MMRKFVALRLSCLLLAPFTLIGCAPQDHVGHASTAAAQQTNTPMLEELSIPLQVTLDPSPAKNVQENTLRITVPAEHAAKLETATVSVSLTMPNMDHGAIVFAAAKEKEGAYVAQIVPTMLGDWLATITFELDGKAMSAAYPFRVEP